MQKHSVYFFNILMLLFVGMNNLHAQILDYDAAVVFPTAPSQYSQTPQSQVVSLTLSANVENQGFFNITNVQLGVKVLKGGAVLSTLTSSNTVASLSNGSASSFSISYLPVDTGLYTFKYYPIRTEIDEDASNDTVMNTFFVSTDKYARHLGTTTGSYGIGTGAGDAMLGSLFTITDTITLGKLQVELDGAVAGTMIKGRIYQTSSGIPASPLSTPLWESNVVTIAGTASQNIDLQSASMPTLLPGTYWFGCLELNYALQVKLYDDIFTPNKQYVYYTTLGSWQTLESQNGNSVLGISPIFGPQCTPPPAPTISFISPSSANDTLILCTGNPVTLGTTTPNIVEYLWYKNGSPLYSYTSGTTNIYVANNNYIVPANTSGTSVYTLAVAYTGATCLSAQSNPLTLIKSKPNAVISPTGLTTFCANNPTTLNATADMANYVWKRGTTTVGTNSASYIPVASGNHSVIVTDANGCSSTSPWINITRYPLPTANAGVDRNLCIGNSVQIGSSNNTANTYTWSPNTNLSNAYIANPICTATTSTNYTVVVTNTSTGCSASDLVAITSLALPSIPTVALSGAGNTRILTPTPPIGAIGMNWYKNGAIIYSNLGPNATISVPVSNPANAYTARARGVNGCLSLASNAVNVRLGEDKEGDILIETDNNIMSVYPNPIQGQLNLTIRNSPESTAQIHLYNTIGQEVKTETRLLTGTETQYSLNISDLPAGIYTLSVQIAGAVYTQKVIKE